MRARRVRHQLFLPEDLSERLGALAARPGASKSSILADALTAWLNRRGASELEDRFSKRLDRLSMALGRIERDGHVLLESLALFIRRGPWAGGMAGHDQGGKMQSLNPSHADVIRFPFASQEISMRVPILAVLTLAICTACSPAAPPGAPAVLAEGRLAAPDLVLPSPPDGKSDLPVALVENGSRIDILFVYTPAALADAGGLSGLEAKAYANEAFLNDALRESLPDVRPAPRANIVGFAQISNGAPARTEALALSAEVRALRARFNADLVVAIHHRYRAGAGVAAPFCNNPVWHSQNGYVALIRSSSMMYYMAPAHEIGHLLGAGHDRAHRNVACLYQDSRGWSFHAETAGRNVHYGDLMDYNADVRLPRFSSPNILYLGVPTGVAGEADNARAVNDGRRVVANYIPLVAAPAPATAGPQILVTSPGREASGAAAGWLTFTARITDPDTVREAQLLWDDGHALACPGAGTASWSCSVTGDIYAWRIDVSAGERRFRIRAVDAKGERAVSRQYVLSVHAAPAQ